MYTKAILKLVSICNNSNFQRDLLIYLFQKIISIIIEMNRKRLRNSNYISIENSSNASKFFLSSYKDPLTKIYILSVGIISLQ